VKNQDEKTVTILIPFYWYFCTFQLGTGKWFEVMDLCFVVK